MQRANGADRGRREDRRAYARFKDITTRWHDNDAYGHVNNVVYYAYFDSAINMLLVEAGLLEIATSDVIGFTVESGCCYFAPIAFPDRIEAGVRVAQIGRSTARYEIGIFRHGDELEVAGGHFVHVYVDRSTKRPIPLPDDYRRFLASLTMARPTA